MNRSSRPRHLGAEESPGSIAPHPPLPTRWGRGWPEASTTRPIVGALIAVHLLSGVGHDGLHGQAPSRPASASQLEAARQKVKQVEPDYIEALYTIARLEASLGHPEDAYLALERASAVGFSDVARLRADAAFEQMQQDALFDALLQRVRRNDNIRSWDSAEREAVQKSDRIIKTLAFRQGERVADIGAGSGRFTFPVAEAVRPRGTVWALDISPAMIEYLDFRTQARKADNVKPRRVLPDDPQLQSGSVDTILMFYTLHYVKDRVAYGNKLREALAPGGRLVVISYATPKVFVREQLDSEMKAAGFAVQASYDLLSNQFFVIYVPETPSGR